MITLLNDRRRALGLPEIRENAREVEASVACAETNVKNGSGLTHCGHEVLFWSSGGPSPEQIMEAWFNSPGHKRALTYGSSRNAGAAIVAKPGGGIVAALTIDY